MFCHPFTRKRKGESECEKTNAKRSCGEVNSSVFFDNVFFEKFVFFSVRNARHTIVDGYKRSSAEFQTAPGMFINVILIFYFDHVLLSCSYLNSYLEGTVTFSLQKEFDNVPNKQIKELFCVLERHRLVYCLHSYAKWLKNHIDP